MCIPSGYLSTQPLAHSLREILAEEQTDEIESKKSDHKTENQCHYDKEEAAHQTDHQQ
jgi:hypothetical protein